MKSDGHVTIEQTAKKYKLRILLSIIGIIVSIIWMVNANAETEPTAPVALFLISAIVYVVTKITIWWNHG